MPEPRTVDAVVDTGPDPMDEQIRRYPGSRHDDRVDSMAYVLALSTPKVVRVDLPEQGSRLNYCKVTMDDGTVHAARLPLDCKHSWSESP